MNLKRTLPTDFDLRALRARRAVEGDSLLELVENLLAREKLTRQVGHVRLDDSTCHLSDRQLVEVGCDVDLLGKQMEVMVAMEHEAVAHTKSEAARPERFLVEAGQEVLEW
jgi:hypothetical protein